MDDIVSLISSNFHMPRARIKPVTQIPEGRDYTSYSNPPGNISSEKKFEN
jgi:hypothetical protein